MYLTSINLQGIKMLDSTCLDQIDSKMNVTSLQQNCLDQIVTIKWEKFTSSLKKQDILHDSQSFNNLNSWCRALRRSTTTTECIINGSFLAWVQFSLWALFSLFCLWWESNLGHPIWCLLGSRQFCAECFQHSSPIECDYWIPFDYKAYLTSINLQG